MKIYVKDYDYLDCFKEKDIVEFEDIIEIIENYESEIHKLEEKYINLVEDVESNYKRLDISEQVGISNENFI